MSWQKRSRLEKLGLLRFIHLLLKKQAENLKDERKSQAAEYVCT